jgi:hypothetical protein
MLSRTKVIILIVIGIGIIVAAIIGFTLQSTNSQTSDDDSTYTDPGSGEKIGEQDKAPQGTEASLENVIIYPGFSKLIDRGLSPVQIQSIQSTIAEFSQQQKEPFKEVSLTTDSMRHLQPKGDSSTHTITFDVVTNRTGNYHITVDFSDTETCVTKIYASDKTTLLIER